MANRALAMNYDSAGLELMRNGKYKQAIEAFHKARELDSELEDCSVHEACAMMQMLDKIGTEDECVSALLANLDEASLFQLGNVNLLNQRFYQADELYRIVSERHFLSIELLINHAFAMLGLGNATEAIRLLTKATILEPEYLMSWQVKANVLLAEHRTVEAVTTMERCIGKNQGNQEVLKAFIHMLIDARQYKHAANLLNGFENQYGKEGCREERIAVLDAIGNKQSCITIIDEQAKVDLSLGLRRKRAELLACLPGRENEAAHELALLIQKEEDSLLQQEEVAYLMLAQHHRNDDASAIKLCRSLLDYEKQTKWFALGAFAMPLFIGQKSTQQAVADTTSDSLAWLRLCTETNTNCLDLWLLRILLNQTAGNVKDVEALLAYVDSHFPNELDTNRVITVITKLEPMPGTGMIADVALPLWEELSW